MPPFTPVPLETLARCALMNAVMRGIVELRRLDALKAADTKLQTPLN